MKRKIYLIAANLLLIGTSGIGTWTSLNYPENSAGSPLAARIYNF